jgi:hypothetical protein
VSEGLRVKLTITLSSAKGAMAGTRWFEESDIPRDPCEFYAFIQREVACAIASKGRKRAILGIGVHLWGVPEALALSLAKKMPPTPELADLWAQDYQWYAADIAVFTREVSVNGKV